MDDLLKLYLPKSDNQIRKIWDESIIVLDANILLNLYRYSTSTREEFLKTLNSIRDNSWIPHQVSLEYLTNRTNVIIDQEKDFKEQSEAIKDGKNMAITEIKKKLDEIKKPFRKIDFKEIEGKIDTFFKQLTIDVVDNNENVIDFNKNDIILKEFLDLFNNKIGPPYNMDELEEIYDEGKTRYENKQPPGYEDSDEKKDEYRLYKDTKIKSKYGDLIVWKQIINIAKKENKPVIFITDDRKSDWWKIARGQKQGPREELINEFFHETNNDLLMYNTESFLRSANKILNANIHEKTLQEIHDYTRNRENSNDSDQDNYIKHKQPLSNYEKMYYLRRLEKEREIYNLNNKIDNTKKKIRRLEFELVSLPLNPYDQDEYEMKIEDEKNHLYRLIAEKKMLEEQVLSRKVRQKTKKA